jgi:peptide/nickel transport system substrate-binding protein
MSRDRSSGIATVMFTDVEASTDTTTRLGDDAAAALFDAHHSLVRRLIADHGGRNVESTGDGFLVLFDSPRHALGCALAIQRELASREDGIRVRIGLNAGEIMEGDDGLFGAAINLTKRVMDRAEGGQVLMTDAVRQLVGTVPEAHFRDRGRFAPKGFPERVRLYEVRPVTRAPPPRPPPRRRRSRRPMIVAAALAAAAVAAGVLIAAKPGEEPVPVTPNSVAVVDAEEGRVVASVPVGVDPTDVAVGNGSVWVTNSADDSVTQIGARSRRVAGSVSPGVAFGGLGVGRSGVWVADTQRPAARVIDPTFRAARSVPLATNSAPSARAVAAADDAVWIAGSAGVTRVDPRTETTVAHVPVGNEPNGVAIGEGAVWISDGLDGTLTRIDPATNEPVALIAVGQGASGVAVDGTGVWVPVPTEDRVKRIDPATNAVADTVRIPGGPAAVAVGEDGVWVTSRRSGTLTRIDPRSATVASTLQIGHSPQGVAVAGGAVWVAVQKGLPAPAVSGAGDVLRVMRPEGFRNGIDPVVAFASQQVVYATCALLFNYPDRPFPAGAELRPEVAAARPVVSDGGRTYRIPVRAGFRFSPPSNAPVTAQAFERALVRQLHPRVSNYAIAMMGDITGADAFHTGRVKRLAGVTARGDTLTIRLTKPSVTLPARLASPMFCAVPPETPISAAGLENIPMAGPYYVAAYRPKRRLVLRRNPSYGGDRPAGPREIDFELDVGHSRAVEAVEAGRADYLGAVPFDRIAALDRRYGLRSPAARAGRQRYFTGPGAVLHYYAFNMHRGLFADARMRRAVNFALDRRALAAKVPIPPGPGRPTDQFKVPGTPGFRDAAIYPLGGPDVQSARRLAGGRRGRAILVTCNLDDCVADARVVRSNLAAIGIEVEVRAVAIDEMFALQGRRDGWDIGLTNWFPDHADPSDAVGPIFGVPESKPTWLRTGALSDRVGAALRIVDVRERAEAIARLDAELARAGAAAPFATAVTTDFFSDRIGCQVHQPIYGISLGALCIRDR